MCNSSVYVCERQRDVWCSVSVCAGDQTSWSYSFDQRRSEGRYVCVAVPRLACVAVPRLACVAVPRLACVAVLWCGCVCDQS